MGGAVARCCLWSVDLLDKAFAPKYGQLHQVLSDQELFSSFRGLMPAQVFLF